MTTGPALPGDYHLHTGFSDGDAEIAAVVDAAAALGLPEIGFSDHLIPAGLGDDYGVAHERLDEYVGAVRASAARRPDLHVLVALEVDYIPGYVEELRELAGRLPLDYVIGSVHAVDGVVFDLDAGFADGLDAEGFQRRYFELVRGAVETGMIDVVGHFDLVRKFGVLPPPGPAALAAADAALRAAATAGVAVEINTAGWRHATGEQYPRRDLLARARGLGVRLTFGSDAHRAADVGARFSDAVAVARAAGYTHTLRLSDREEVPLP